MDVETRIAVIGLGYVGLPVALAFSRKFPGTIGFDVDESRIETLKAGLDRNADVSSKELDGGTLLLTSDEGDLTQANFYVVAVPTPIDDDRRPDLGALREASTLVGEVISKGAVVVFESTVYPGVTEEFCGPIIEEISGLRQGVDFFLGYSPERINPGDREHTLEKIVKVVSGDTDQTLNTVAEIYGLIIEAGVYRAPSIKVAEAAKVIENTQRDLNIALMNELALIFDLLGISTSEVLKAARTKWNFLPFTPGLVGGHCIGVDPYYLTTKAEQLGYQPQVILAGRRINDGMGQYVAQRSVKLLANTGRKLQGARAGILGLTFKENVPDIRNSRVPSIVEELKAFGLEVTVHDPIASVDEAEAEYGLSLVSWDAFKDFDLLILAVAHQEFVDRGVTGLTRLVAADGVFIDVKSAIDREQLPSSLVYWSL